MGGQEQFPEMLGGYRLLRRVGSGGMGIVFEAWDTRLDRRVAIKVLHPHLAQDRKFCDQFLQEARNAARIEHPGIARIYRVDDTPSGPVLEMQYVEAASLRALLASGPLSLQQTVDIARQVLDALQACHERGIIHCDLKPGNLLVSPSGQVILTDFGIARASQTEADAGAQQSLPRWGTPLYCPPEAWTASAATPQRDLYALGVLLYEALAGQPPFRATSCRGLRDEKGKTSPAVRLVRPEVSLEFSKIIKALLAPKAADRPASARDALALLLATPEAGLHPEETIPLDDGDDVQDAANRAAPRAFGRYLVLFAAFFALLTAGWWLWRPAPAESGLAAPVFPALAPEEGVFCANPSNLTMSGQHVYFTAEDSLHGRELWTLVGDNRAKLVADLVPGPESSNPSRLYSREPGIVVFAASTPETGSELWSLSNSGGGNIVTKLVKDILPGQMGSDPEVVATHANLIYFYATTLTAGRELWCTNMNPAQTAMVGDIQPGRDNSQPMQPRCLSSEQGLYVLGFTDAARGIVLWQHLYEHFSTREVGDVNDEAFPLAVLNNMLLFSNADPEHGMELWSCDNTTGEMKLFLDVWPGPESSGPTEAFTWGDRALFRATTEDEGAELWITDGTQEGTHLLADLNPGKGDSDPYAYFAGDSVVFFRAQDDEHGKEAWVTGGTRETTQRLTDIVPGRASSDPYNFAPLHDRLFFTSKSEAYGEELWEAFLVEGQWRVEMTPDLLPGPEGAEPHDMRWLNDTNAVFVAKTSGNQGQLMLLQPEVGGPSKARVFPVPLFEP